MQSLRLSARAFRASAHLCQPQPSKGLGQGVEAAEGQAEGAVADKDLRALPPAVDGGVGVEVVGPARVLAPGHVCDEVQRPVQQ